MTRIICDTSSVYTVLASALSAGTLRPVESGSTRANGPGNSRETPVVNLTSHYVTVCGP